MAEKTGWSEHFIVWELPLYRLYQYFHAALRAADVWTVLPLPPDTESVKATLRAVNEAIADDIRALEDECDD